MAAVYKPRRRAAAAPKRPAGTMRSVPPRATVVLVPGLRYWRTKRALLQRELADRAGVNRTTVQRAEDASRPHAIRLDMVRKLAEALDVDPGELMREPPER